MTEIKLNTEYTYEMYYRATSTSPDGIQFTFKITQINIETKTITLNLIKCINYTPDRENVSSSRYVTGRKQLTINDTIIFDVTIPVSLHTNTEGTIVNDGVHYIQNATLEIPYTTDAPTIKFKYFKTAGSAGISYIDTQAISYSGLYINNVNQTKLYINSQPIKVLYVNNNAVYYNENNS